jgi:hypothetical protein
MYIYELLNAIQNRSLGMDEFAIRRTFAGSVPEAIGAALSPETNGGYQDGY